MSKQPRYKICRRLGPGVFEQCQTPKFAASEERKNKNRVRGKRRKNLSDYGIQVLEKQKMRFTYGVSEKQFSKYAKLASKKKGVIPAEYLYQSLETRLDNIAYRLGFAPTRSAARQFVSHGHASVNGRRVTVPSYTVKVGDKITITERAKNRPFFSEIEKRVGEIKTPNWITFDKKKLEASISGKPELSKDDVLFDITSVLEFYSR